MKRIKGLLVLLFFSFLTPVNAQSPSKEVKMDPYLARFYKASKAEYLHQLIEPNNPTARVSEEKLKKAKKALWQEFKDWPVNIEMDDPVVPAIMEYIGSESHLKIEGLQIGSKVGNFYTISFPLSKLEQLLEMEGVIAVEMGRPVEKEEKVIDSSFYKVKASFFLDEGDDMIEATTARSQFGYEGEGVVIGFIDSGIDFEHPAFTQADGTSTRIISIWDQTIGTGFPPDGFSYGTEYTKQQILQGGVPHRDNDGHGTHVAGIAAGNGRTAVGQTPYIGVAPKAEIIMVKFAGNGPYVPWDPSKTNTTNILDGINYIAHKASVLNKPWVVNLSWGVSRGPRNGTSLFERAVTAYANDHNFGRGRIIVKSAGNEGVIIKEDNNHARGYGNAVKEFQAGGQTFFFEMFYPENETCAVIVTSPTGKVYGPVLTGSSLGTRSDGLITINNLGGDMAYGGLDNIVTVSAVSFDTDDNGYLNIPPKGIWKFQVVGASNTAMPWDAYTERYGGMYFTEASADNSHMISEPGNAYGVITVGAVYSKESWTSVIGPYSQNLPDYSYGKEVNYSSKGPTRDGRGKPEIYAPGSMIASAYSQYDESKSLYPNGIHTEPANANLEYTYKGGTSMAAPFVSGAAALLLEKWVVEGGMDYSYNQISKFLINGVKINVGNDNKPVLNVLNSLTFGSVPVGLEDDIEFVSGSHDLILNTTQSYTVAYRDKNQDGDYGVKYEWELRLFYSDAHHIQKEVVLGSGSQSTWSLSVNEKDIPNFNWTRNSKGYIMGEIHVSCLDNDGVWHSTSYDIGIPFKPNKPVVYKSDLDGVTLNLSYIAAGANSYNIYYSNTPCPPFKGVGLYQGLSPLNSTTTSFALKHLSSTKTYYVAVSAVNKAGESELSDIIKIGEGEDCDNIGYPIVWTDLVNTYVTGANDLRKSSNVNVWWNGGAATKNIIPSNTDGWVQTIAQDVTTDRMLGLSHTNVNSTWNTIEYNLYLNRGNVEIYESGARKGGMGAYVVGDTFRIERKMNKILFKKNGEVLYSSICDRSKSLIGDVCLYSPSAGIYSGRASTYTEELHNFIWNNTHNVTIQDNYTTIVKTSGGSDWNAGGNSLNKLPRYSDGWFSTKAVGTTQRAFGFSYVDGGLYWNNIDFCIYLTADKKLVIYERGHAKRFITYEDGDVFKMERRGNYVIYYQNGAQLYASPCAYDKSLIFDASFYTPYSRLSDFKISFKGEITPPKDCCKDIDLRKASTVYTTEGVSIKAVDISKEQQDSLKNSYKKVYYNEANLNDSIVAENKKDFIKVSPNPFDKELILSYQFDDEKEVVIELINQLNSKLIYSKKYKLKKGKDQLKLNLNGVVRGIYILKVRGKDEEFLFRVSKE